VALAIKNGRPVVLVAPEEAASRFFLGLPGAKIRVVPSADEAAAIAGTLLDNR